MRYLSTERIADGRTWCIAGGFAACPQLATDCDVWFLNCEKSDRDDVLDTLHRHRRLHGLQFTEERNEASSGSYELGEEGILHWKVAKLADGRQIILTNATTVEQLLKCFDISTHQCALTSDGEFVKGSGWTPITEPPEVLWYNNHTDERLEKITRRYRQFVEA